MLLTGTLLLTATLVSSPAHATAPWSGLLRESRTTHGKSMSDRVQHCLIRAAQHFQVPMRLLQAIAQVESGGNPRAVNRANRNGSRDVGLMQINSSWLPTLARWNIREDDLFDPCISAHVGAWILADNLARLGPVWRAVGAYNARSPTLQLRYVKRVQRQLEALARDTGVSEPPPATAETGSAPPPGTPSGSVSRNPADANGASP